MEEAVSEGWVCSRLHERSDKQSQGPDLDIENSQAAILLVSEENKFTGLFKQILVEPGFDAAVNVVKVIDSEVDGATSVPDL